MSIDTKFFQIVMAVVVFGLSYIVSHMPGKNAFMIIISVLFVFGWMIYGINLIRFPERKFVGFSTLVSLGGLCFIADIFYYSVFSYEGAVVTVIRDFVILFALCFLLFVIEAEAHTDIQKNRGKFCNANQPESDESNQKVQCSGISIRV